MKNIFLTLLILIFPLLLSGEPYDLNSLIESGLQNSYDIQQEEANYKNYRSFLTSSWLGLLPTATISVSSQNAETVLTDSLSSPGRDWTNSAWFSLSKTISLNEPSYYNVRTSILDKRSAELSYDDMRRTVAFNIFSKYLYVLESQKDLSIQRDNLKLQEKIHAQIQVQYATGEKSLLELKQSEISLIDYEIAVNEAENTLIQLRQDLFSYLNMKDSGYELSEPEFDIREDEISFQENNTLFQKRNSLKSSKLSLFQQKMDFLPSLTLGYQYYNNSLGEDITDFDDYEDRYTISLTASYSIFGLLEKRESYLRLRRNVRIQELDLEISKKDQRETLSNLESDMRTLRRSRDLYEDKLNLAKSNLEMAQEQFRLGIISLLDLDKAKLDYSNAQLSYNNRYYELIRKQEEINQTLSQPILGVW